ncbi:methyltransferase [Streptomyces sp. CNQ-509]|uniref:SAM-dependent methyltransferase n=1 Tax=Streptomyces sp. CNQ-509 TaxID=444103 RepID=UPI00062DF565|nr:SAM-dependent methyltransferase [Streptomyces sp. CNQ-509]AKH83988.1 methyltransferase [Streptomyces sp. CNQ-509]
MREPRLPQDEYPGGIDVTRPHPARMYDYYLGGKDNYAPDRAAAQEVMRRAPQAAPSARANRAWMHRVVHYLVQEAGVRQFLDVGTGIPTEPNLHQVAQAAAAECRVVYVDNDPIVLAHARALMASTDEGRTEYIDADLHEPEDLLAQPVLRETLDFSRPIALVLSAVGHFVPELARAREVVATLSKPLPPGSYLALSHATADFDPKVAGAAAAVYGESRATASMTPRTHAEVLSFFDGCALIEPGVAPVNEWRPDELVQVGSERAAWIYGGLGRLDRRAAA